MGTSDTPRLLVVEDDPPTRAFLVEALEDEGYAVETAPHGAAALDRLVQPPADARRPPDAVLLDLRMPVMDGEAFLRAYGARVQGVSQAPMPSPARASGRATPVGLMTGMPLSPDRLARLAAYGVPVRVLRKPFAVDDLLQFVADLAAPA
jgi:CheY-like chemotaxis protein